MILDSANGESCVNLDDFDNIKKENTQSLECSSFVKFGDPYGNRKSNLGFSNFPYNPRNRITKPFPTGDNFEL